MKYIRKNIKDMNTNKKRTNKNQIKTKHVKTKHAKTKRSNKKKVNTIRHQTRKFYGGNEEEEKYKTTLIDLASKYQTNPSSDELYRFLEENKNKPYFSTIQIKMDDDVFFYPLDYILYKWPNIRTSNELDMFLKMMRLFNDDQIKAAFFFCLFYGNLYCVNLLLKNSLVDVNSVNDKGVTALGLICIRLLHYRKITQIEELLKRDPTEVTDPTMRTFLKNPNRGNEENLLTNIFIKLIEYGADINQPFSFDGQNMTIMDIQKQLPLQYQSNYINLFIFGILNFGTYANIMAFKNNMLTIFERNNSCKVVNKLCRWFTVKISDPTIKEYICFIFLVLTLLNNTLANNQFTILVKGRRAIQSSLYLQNKMYNLKYIQTDDIDVLVVPSDGSTESSEWYAKNIVHFIYWLFNVKSGPYQIINTQVPESNIFKISVKTPSGNIVPLCDISYGYNSIPESIKTTLFTTEPYKVRTENSVYTDTILNYGNELVGLLTHQNIDQLIDERFYYLYTYSRQEAFKNPKNKAFFFKLCKQLKEISVSVFPQNISEYITTKLQQYKSRNIVYPPSAYSNEQIKGSPSAAEIEDPPDPPSAYSIKKLVWAIINAEL